MKTFDLEIIQLNALLVYGIRHIKTKIMTYDGTVFIIFCLFNVPEDALECESCPIISIDLLLVYENNYYLQLYLDNCAYKTVYKQMTDYRDDNVFETHKD